MLVELTLNGNSLEVTVDANGLIHSGLSFQADLKHVAKPRFGHVNLILDVRILGASVLPGVEVILGVRLPGSQRIPGGRVPEARGIAGSL